MKLTGSKSALNDATRRLMADWTRTKEKWRDKKGRDFESSYLGDLNERVNTTMRAIDELDRLLARIENDCE